MRGREITLWLDERWYDALRKQLKGETLEEHLENVLDEMCNQLPQREYERISHELWAEQQAEKEAREAARRFAVFHVTESGSSDYILAEENLELLRVACRLRSYIRKPPGEAPHRFVETLPRTQRISQEEFNSYVSERLDNTGRVVGAYDIDLDSGDMEAVSIMDGWKRFRIRDVSTAAYFAMKKGNAAPDERWRIFLDRLEERTLNQSRNRNTSLAVGGSAPRTSPSPRTLFKTTTCWSSTWKYRSMRIKCSELMSAPPRMTTG